MGTFFEVFGNYDLNRLSKAALVELIRLRTSLRLRDEAGTRSRKQSLLLRTGYFYSFYDSHSLKFTRLLSVLRSFHSSGFMTYLSFARLVVSIIRGKGLPRSRCLRTWGNQGGSLMVCSFCPRRQMPSFSLYECKLQIKFMYLCHAGCAIYYFICIPRCSPVACCTSNKDNIL